MLNTIREFRILRDEGIIHSRLISRIRILLSILSVIAIIVAFDIIVREANVIFIIALGIIGFFPGLLIFSRISVVEWNEEKSLIEIGRTDLAGYVSLGIYVVYEIILHFFLPDILPEAGGSLVLALAFGTLLGRVIGIIIEVHKVFLHRARNNRP